MIDVILLEEYAEVIRRELRDRKNSRERERERERARISFRACQEREREKERERKRGSACVSMREGVWSSGGIQNEQLSPKKNLQNFLHKTLVLAHSPRKKRR